MRAIIRVGSHQYDVEAGKTVQMEKLDGPIGSEVRFNNIVYASDGKDVKLGLIKGAVFGTIRAQERGPKIAVLKKTRRKGFHKKIGHRQPFTKVKITKIEVQ
jgi:large subunit ribosomal protein L21